MVLEAFIFNMATLLDVLNPYPIIVKATCYNLYFKTSSFVSLGKGPFGLHVENKSILIWSIYKLNNVP